MNEQETTEALTKLWEDTKPSKGKYAFIDYHMNQIRRKNKGYFVEPDAKTYMEELLAK